MLFFLLLELDLSLRYNIKMFANMDIKKISNTLVKSSLLMSFFVLNFILPMFSIVMLSNHELITSNENGAKKLIFHHGKDSTEHKKNYVVTLNFDENKQSHHDHFIGVEVFPDMSLKSDITTFSNYKYGYFSYLIDTKIFDYSFYNKNKYLDKEVNFSPQKEDTISKSLKTIVLTI